MGGFARFAAPRFLADASADRRRVALTSIPYAKKYGGGLGADVAGDDENLLLERFGMDAGESAADIASECSKVAAATTLWSRRFPTVAPRFPAKANLWYTSRRSWASLGGSASFRGDDR